MACLAGRTVGLDGVVDQQDNYRKSGFVLAGRNIRYTGVPRPLSGTPTRLRRPGSADLADVVAYDRRHFPAGRAGFIREWIKPGNPSVRRTSLISVAGGSHLSGLGTIRVCRAGYKIGPLQADDRDTADTLFRALCDRVPAGAEITLDVPEANAEAVALAVSAGLQPVFETARMYRGTAPDLPLDRIYGITTFELG